MSVVLVPLSWSDYVSDVMHEALCDDADLIAAEVAAGESELFAVKGHGLLVTRIEEDFLGERTLVLVAAVGRDVGPVVEGFKVHAKALGINKLRAHSSRVGMPRMLSRYGFEVTETVMEAML